MSAKYSIPVEQLNSNKRYNIFEHNNDSSMFLIATCNNKNYAIMISNLLNEQSINIEHLDNEFDMYKNILTYNIQSIIKYDKNNRCISSFMILEHNSDEDKPKLIAESHYLAYARLISEYLNKNLSLKGKNVNKTSV